MSSMMPSLPGMYYCAQRQRYFAITHDNPAPPPPQPTPTRTPPPKRLSIARLLQLREQDSSMHDAKLVARLLATGVRTDVTSPALPWHAPRWPAEGSPAFDALASFVPVIRDGQLKLRSFPSGVSVHRPDSFDVYFCADWRGGHLAAAGVRRGHYTASFERPVEDPDMYIRLPGAASAVVADHLTGSVGGFLAAAVGGSTHVFDLGIGRERTVLRKTKGSAGLALETAARETLMEGTRRGDVHVFDMRAGVQPMTGIRRSGKRCSVVCLRVSKCLRRVFVSTLLNQPGNLAAYDMRMLGAGVQTTFAGHVNKVKMLRFDVQKLVAGGQLLAAGGDDGVVRFWDADVGGQPVEHVEFPGEMPMVVQLKGWGVPRKQCRWAPPGLWVSTDRSEYVLHSHA